MDTNAKLFSAISKRRSIRRYRPIPIGRPMIEQLIVAAAQAPSAHNRQPWRFVVLEQHERRERLAAAMGQRLRQDRTADGDDPQSIETDVGRSRERITQAPAVVLVCIDMRDMDRYPDERRRRAEYMMAVQSTAMATQNLLLAAEQEGLGACVMCAPLFCPDVVAEVLRLPQDWQPQILVTLGHPYASGKLRDRLPLDEIVIWPDSDQPAR